MIHDVFLYTKKSSKGHPGYIIEHDSRNLDSPPLLETLKRHILRSKVRVQDVSDEYDVWQVWDPQSTPDWETKRHWSFTKSGVIEPVWPDTLTWPWGTEELIIRDRRAVGMGARILVSKAEIRTQIYIVVAEFMLLNRLLKPHRRLRTMWLAVTPTLCTEYFTVYPRVLTTYLPCKHFQWNRI